jgi:hypothetical protein
VKYNKIKLTNIIIDYTIILLNYLNNILIKGGDSVGDKNPKKAPKKKTGEKASAQVQASSNSVKKQK